MVELHHADNIGRVALRAINLHLLSLRQLILANCTWICCWSRGASVSSLSSFSACSFAASLSSMSPASPCLVFGSGTGSLWVDFSSDSRMGTLGSWHYRVIREGCMRAPIHCL